MNPLVSDTKDSLFLFLWRKGHPVVASELGPWSEETKLVVLDEERAGRVKRDFLATIRCPDCRARLVVVRRTIPVCEGCKRVWDARREFHPEFYAYSADLSRVNDLAVDRLREAGFERSEQGVASNLTARGTRYIASMQNIRGQQLDVVIATETVKRETLYQLWGLARIHHLNVVLVHPGLAPQAEQLLELGIEVSPILPVDYRCLTLPESVQKVALFPTYRERLARSLARISSTLLAETESGQTDLFDISPDELDRLSREGGVKYERPALKLLMALGPAVVFAKTGWTPDGVLLGPNGFWIVDPKSSMNGFRFSASEKDKIARYLELMLKKESAFGPSLRCFGEIIVTPTDNVSENVLDATASYLRVRAPRHTVSVVSHEGLVWLWHQIDAEPNYWHMRDPIEDAFNLLTLQPKCFVGGAVPESSSRYIDTPCKLIGLDAFKAYWDLLRDRNVFHGLGGRTPAAVSELVQGMFVQEYSRTKPSETPPVREPVGH